MAPKAATKRPAGAAPQSEPEAKVAKRPSAHPAEKFGISPEAYDAVLEGLAQATHLSDACRDMLLAVVPNSLAVAADLRSPQQATVVNMLEEALNEVAAKLQEGVTAAQAELALAEVAKGEKAVKVKEAEAVVANALEAVTAKKVALAEASAAHGAAKAAVVIKQKEQQEAGAALAEANAELEHLESAIGTQLKALVDGSWEKVGEAKKMVTVVVNIFKKLEAEASLMAALPGVLGKKPANRGAFDQTLLGEVTGRLEGRVAELKAKVQAASTSDGERAAAVAEVEAALAGASATLDAAASAVTAAQAAQGEASGLLAAATEELDATGPAFEAAAAALAAKQGQLESFHSVTLPSFAALRDRRTPAPVEEAPAVEGADASAAAPAPEAAAAA